LFRVGSPWNLSGASRLSVGLHITGIRMRSMLLWLIGIPIPIIIILWLVTGHA
jgi:hypothetical protein